MAGAVPAPRKPRNAARSKSRGLPRNASAPPLHRDDDVRPRRNSGRADRASRALAAAAGRNGGLYRLHLLDVSAGPHGDVAHSAGRRFEYLKTQAVGRLYLDNIPNIQSIVGNAGEKIGQMALFFGANDMGSLMIEENVVAQAGTVHYLSLETIRRSIEEVGYIPRQRNVFYQYIDRYDPSAPSNRITPAPRTTAHSPPGDVGFAQLSPGLFSGRVAAASSPRKPRNAARSKSRGLPRNAERPATRAVIWIDNCRMHVAFFIQRASRSGHPRRQKRCPPLFFLHRQPRA